MNHNKYNNYEIFMMNILHCGIADLELLADVRSDILEDVIEHFNDEVGMDNLNINSLMREIFYFKFDEITDAINDRINELENLVELTEDEEEELKIISSLDVYEDIDSFHNYIDTSVYFVDSDKGDIYKKYFENEIESFEKDTGFYIH